MEYTLTRSRRKTVTIRVLPGGELEVKAPLRFPKAEIDRLLEKKSGWIEKARANMPAPPQLFAQGTRLPFLGTEYPLRFRETEPAGVREGKLFLPLSPLASGEEVKSAAEAFYRQAAKELLPQKLQKYAALLGVSWEGLRVTGAKTRWGSCSAKGSVNFSWRLMAAPESCIDYVVVHELCHRLHFDHSPAFHAAVAAVFPDWKRRRDNLNQFRQLCW